MLLLRLLDDDHKSLVIGSVRDREVIVKDVHRCSFRGLHQRHVASIAECELIVRCLSLHLSNYGIRDVIEVDIIFLS